MVKEDFDWNTFEKKKMINNNNRRKSEATGMSRDRYKDSHITMAQKLLLQKPPKPLYPRCFDAPKPWRPLGGDRRVEREEE